jgi:hypothetical protein
MKKNIFILSVSIVVIAMGALLYFLLTPQDKSEKTSEATQTELGYKRADLEKVFDSPGVGSWGFASTKNGICYAESDFSLRFYSFDTGSPSVIAAGQTDTDSIKIVSTDNSCLFHIMRGETSSLYLYSDKLSELNFEAVSPVKANLDYYIIETEQSMIVLDGAGKQVFRNNDPSSVFKLAPVSQTSSFAVANYDFELQSGKLFYIQNGTTKELMSVSKVVDLTANQETALLTYDDGLNYSGALVSTAGEKIAEVKSVDPSSVRATGDGYYFVTKPGSKDSGNNEFNSVQFISNSGDTSSYLSSSAQTADQFDAKRVDYQNKLLFFQEEGTIYKLKV